MTPEPTDKLDATTNVAVNGPADDSLQVERIVRRRATGPTRLARAGCRETGTSGVRAT